MPETKSRAQLEAEKNNLGKPTAQIDKAPKKTIKDKVLDFIFGDKLDNIGTYLSNRILKPTLTQLGFNLGVGALSMILFNNPNAGGNIQIPNFNGVGSGGSAYFQNKYNSTPQTPYWQMSQPMQGDFRVQNQGYGMMSGGYNGGAPQNFAFISFDTQDDALLEIERLKAVVRQYGRVRLRDFYSDVGYSGTEPNWTLDGCGWINLEGAQAAQRTDGRWFIDFPPIISITQMR